MLNRRDAAKKLSLKIVKELKKKKNRYVNVAKSKNDAADISTWTCEHCKSFLKSYGAVQQGNRNELINRCVMLKHLIENELETLTSLSKTELRSMCVELKLPDIKDMSKDNMIKSVSDAMLGIHGDTAIDVLALIDEEESDESLI